MTISRARAEELANELIASRGVASGSQFALMHHKTIESEGGWVFFYNSREFIETGNPASALAGNCPILVNKNGDVHELPSDLKIIEPIAAIRKSPQIYIGDDPIGVRFVERVVSDLILLDAGPLRVARHGDWYSIAAEKDWLMSEDGIVSFEPFHRVVSMPSGGLFYITAEVILNALTEAVVTAGSDGLTWISGEATHGDLPDDLKLALAPQTGRIVAFYFSKFHATPA